MNALLARAAATVVVGASIAVAVGDRPGHAADVQRLPRGTPDPQEMVLTRADLGGARVIEQRYYRDRDFPSVISYYRDFEGGSVGRTQLAFVESEGEVGRNAVTTAAFLLAFRRVFASPEGRQIVATALKEAAGPDVSIRVTVGRPRALGAGPGSFDVLATARLLGARLDLHIAAFAVERVLGIVTAVGAPGTRVPLAAMTRLARTQYIRTAIQVVPQSVTLPSVAGTPLVRATLTASPGSWTGNPAAFRYQWQRCDANAIACTPIRGATTRTYAVTDADVGARLRVAVTARGLLRSDPATSAATDVVLVFVDTFEGASASAFSFSTTGSGASIAQMNGRLEITMPAGTTLGAEGYAIASAFHNCRLTGDFDMQVDYLLLSGLLPAEGINVGFNATEFMGDTFSGQHGMFVHNAGGVTHGISTHFPDPGVFRPPYNDFVADSSTTGTLRLVRTTRAGVTTVTASRLTGSAWSFTSLPYAPPTSQAASVNLFTNRSPFSTEVRVAFDNFRITSGALSCP